MGIRALITVMGMSFVLGLIAISIHRSNTSAVENLSSYYKFSNARNIAHSGINLGLRYIDKNDTSNAWYETMLGGKDSITAITSADTLWMTSKAWFTDTTYRIDVKLQRYPKPFPSVNAAIGIRATPVTFTTSGNVTLDGRNYTADGSTLVSDTTTYKEGVGTWTSADSARVATSGATISGSPPVTKDTTTPDPNYYINEYILNADYTYYTPGTIAGNLTWGSQSNPVIVVCNAGKDTSFSIKFSGSITGWGILVVMGNLAFTGGLSFHGLVVVSGINNTVQFSESGTPQIVGGLIVAGSAAASLSLKGTGSVGGKVKYSSDALNKAKNVNKLLAYKILSWYE